MIRCQERSPGRRSKTNSSCYPWRYMFWGGHISCFVLIMNIYMKGVMLCEKEDSGMDHGTFCIFGSMPPITIHAASESAGGEISSGLIWHYDGRGTLHICGSGSIPDYASAAKQPWAAFANEIKTLVIDHGVTSIGAYAFANCIALSQADLAESIQYIKSNAFSGCTALGAVPLPLSLWSIAGEAFSGCSGLHQIIFQGYAPASEPAPSTRSEPPPTTPTATPPGPPQ